MANEIKAPSDTGKSLCAVILTPAGLLYTSGGNLTLNDINWQASVAMAEQGTTGIYYGNFPALPAGRYSVLIYAKVGSAPGRYEDLVAHGTVDWDGTLPVTNSSINTRLSDETSSGSSSAFLQLPTSLVSASATSIRAGDVLPIRRAQLVDNNGVAINLTGCTVQYALYTRPTIDLRISLKKFQKDAEVLFAELGFVQYAWAAGDTDTPGKFDEEWTVTDASGNVFTVPGAINSLVTILGHGG